MTLTLPPATTMTPEIEDLPAAMHEPLASPRSVAAQYPLCAAAQRTVRNARSGIRAILRREDERLIVVVGPCSVHDPEAALDYASRLNRLRGQFEDRLLIVMRVYLEKPRTTVGWRGLINDPFLDGSFAMADGLVIARKLLSEINAMGLPAATEMLDLSVPAYLADLVSFAGIGARTTESQPHRALASGLPMPVGFKNGTDGGLQTALDALVSSGRPHSYIGIDSEGRSSLIRTAGNRDCVLTLRGGRASGPNYDAVHIAEAERRLRGLESVQPPSVLVDCSHANSNYDPARQFEACRSVAAQRRDGNRTLRGIMIESNLVAGKQPLIGDGTDRLRYGVSITDACLDWDDTEQMLGELYRSAV